MFNRRSVAVVLFCKVTKSLAQNQIIRRVFSSCHSKVPKMFTLPRSKVPKKRGRECAPSVIRVCPLVVINYLNNETTKPRVLLLGCECPPGTFCPLALAFWCVGEVEVVSVEFNDFVLCDDNATSVNHEWP